MDNKKIVLQREELTVGILIGRPYENEDGKEELRSIDSIFLSLRRAKELRNKLNEEIEVLEKEYKKQVAL